MEGAVERSETEGGFIIQGADVGDLREGARFFTDAVGHFPSFWELSLRKKTARLRWAGPTLLW